MENETTPRPQSTYSGSKRWVFSNERERNSVGAPMPTQEEKERLETIDTAKRHRGLNLPTPRMETQGIF